MKTTFATICALLLATAVSAVPVTAPGQEAPLCYRCPQGYTREGFAGGLFECSLTSSVGTATLSTCIYDAPNGQLDLSTEQLTGCPQKAIPIPCPQ